MAEDSRSEAQVISQLSLDGRVPIYQVYNPFNQAHDLFYPDFETEPDYSVELIFANDQENDQPEWFDVTMTPSIKPGSLTIEEIQNLLGNNSPLDVKRDLLPDCKVDPETLSLKSSYANIFLPIFTINEDGLAIFPWTKKFNPEKNFESPPYFFEITYPVSVGEMLNKHYGTLPGNHSFRDLLVTCGVRFANRNIQGINQKIQDELNHGQSDLGKRLRKIVDPLCFI